MKLNGLEPSNTSSVEASPLAAHGPINKDNHMTKITKSLTENAAPPSPPANLAKNQMTPLPSGLRKELFETDRTAAKERLEQEIEAERANLRNQAVWKMVEEKFFSSIQKMKEEYKSH